MKKLAIVLATTLSFGMAAMVQADAKKAPAADKKDAAKDEKKDEKKVEKPAEPAPNKKDDAPVAPMTDKKTDAPASAPTGAEKK